MNVADPATGLTPQDRAFILDTWTTFRGQVRANAMALFMVLFERYPEYQSLFRGFAHVPPEELPTNRRLMAHALAVVYFLTSIIENLDDTQIVVRTSPFSGAIGFFADCEIGLPLRKLNACCCYCFGVYWSSSNEDHSAPNISNLKAC